MVCRVGTWRKSELTLQAPALVAQLGARGSIEPLFAMRQLRLARPIAAVGRACRCGGVLRPAALASVAARAASIPRAFAVGRLLLRIVRAWRDRANTCAIGPGGAAQFRGRRDTDTGGRLGVGSRAFVALGRQSRWMGKGRKTHDYGI